VATETTVDVVMPQMGVSVSEGTITKWLKGPGESVQADEALLEISTDKVDTEVPSPASGVVAELLVQEGETVAVGTRIAVISAGDGAGPVAPVPAEPPAAPAEPAPAPSEPATAPAAAEAAAPSSAEATPPTAASVPEARPAPPAAAETTEAGNGRGEGRFVSPVVARIAAEHGVDVARVAGTGRGGRVTKKDILDYIESAGITPAAAAAAAPPAPAAPAAPAPVAPPPPPPAAPPPSGAAPPPPAAVAPTPPGTAEPGEGEVLEPLTPMRKGIAEHMRRSLDTSAHVTAVFEVDMSRVVAARERLKREYEQQHGVKLTYLAYVCRATVETLRKWPWMNGELRGDHVVVKQHVNLGIAVALEGGRGLIVPVIRNAEEKNLVGIARGIQDLAERARTKKLLPDDVQGGTFTVTNPGGYGEIIGTPIISQPQVAILDTAAMVKRPVVVSDEHGNDVIAIRPMMNLCLSFDHRLIDGAYAGQFMRDLKAALESWDEGSD
jgi:2-oxoglutarate dehydrogenase E2 component (dihydrolipoamide succinyltransferase)